MSKLDIQACEVDHDEEEYEDEEAIIEDVCPRCGPFMRGCNYCLAVEC